MTYDAGPHPDRAVVDVNGDGKLDIVAMNWDGTVSVLMNEGNGTFAPKVTYNDIGTGQTSMAIADLNGDGLPDIITSDYYGGVEGHDVSVMINEGNGTFGTPTFYGTSSGPFGVAVADLNGDGKPDIVTSNWDTGTISVLVGNGNGTFQPSVTVATAGDEAGSVAIADLNHDGKPDLVVGNYADDTVSVLLGNGDGTFKPQVIYAAGYDPSGVSLADLNGDGNEDIIVANQNDGTASVLMGNGDGTFAPLVTYSSGDYQPNGVRETNVAVGDLNGDGLPDLVTADRYGNTIRVLLSQNAPILGQIYTIAPSTSSTTTTISAPSAGFGNDAPVTITVSSTGGTPTGNVSLGVDNGTSISEPLSNGSANFNLSGLSVGTHGLVATYAAQSNFLGSSANASLVVSPASSTTKVSASSLRPDYGQPVTFTAVVSASVAGMTTLSGSVQFEVDGVDFGADGGIGCDRDGELHNRRALLRSSHDHGRLHRQFRFRRKLRIDHDRRVAGRALDRSRHPPRPVGHRPERELYRDLQRGRDRGLGGKLPGRDHGRCPGRATRDGFGQWRGLHRDRLGDSGSGTLELNLIDWGTITDAAGDPLGGLTPTGTFRRKPFSIPEGSRDS